MSEINLQSEVNNVENANDNVITEAEFAILEKEIKKQGRKLYFKTGRITLLFGALLLGIGVLAFSLFEESLMLTGIALLSVPILLVVFIIVIVKIYKPYSKNYKEFKQKLNENPEIKKAYRQKNRKNFLIRLIILIILIVLFASFIDSGKSDPYDGYSADYKYNEEYRENVDKIADDYGEDAKDVDRVIQNIAGSQ